MKKIFTILATVFISAAVSAQVPRKMNYQAVIRNSSNALVTSTAVGMRISILKGSAIGNAVYVETQMPVTNANGLASLGIGSGTVVSGMFSAIDWANGPYFIKTETDPAGGTNYTIIGTSELMSVPYALFSENGPNGGSSSWTANGSNIFNSNTGNVGIGTGTPTSKLTIQTPINSAGWTHTGGNDSIIVGEAIGGISAAIGVSTQHILRLTAGTSGRIQVVPDGNVIVGDNTVAPFGRFTVRTPNNSYGISHTSNEGNILATRIGGTSAGIGTFTNTHMRIFCNGFSAITITSPTYNVGVGIDFPANKFEVNGTIRSKEVIVEAINWPDYVFDEKYKLPLLNDVENFIRQNKHLPNIPSSAEIEKKGLYLGDTEKKMMEKIEELTLYIIELSNRIKILEAKK